MQDTAKKLPYNHWLIPYKTAVVHNSPEIYQIFDSLFLCNMTKYAHITHGGLHNGTNTW